MTGFTARVRGWCWCLGPLGGLRHHPACLVESLRGIKGCVRVILDLNGD